MSQLAFLIQDVFTFLSLLSADDVRPIGPRYLPPSALSRLNHLLVIPDSLDIQHLRSANGRWRVGVRVRASERHAERIRFIHYLAEAALLVARTGAFLKPTPRTAQWLTASNDRRASILVRAAFPAQPTRGDDERWRAFRLPGNHLASPLAALNQLLDLLRQAPRDERIKIATLLKLLALPAYDDNAPDHQPETTLRALLKLLQWFEVIAWDSASSMQLTPVGAVLLERPDAASLPPDRKPKPLHWSKPRGETILNLIASLDASFPLLWELSEYAAPIAALSSARQTRRLYQLDPARVRRALDRGNTITHIHEFLERATGDALPRVVADWLYRLGREYGRITLRQVTLLEVYDPALLTELTRSKYIRQCLRRTLSPRAVVVRPSRLDALVRRLQQRSYHPRLELPADASTTRPPDPCPERRRGNATIRLFDHPTLAHLYLSARLTHQLADLIPAPYRPPYSVLLDLEQQLTAHDRALADERVGDCIQEMKQRADHATTRPRDHTTIRRPPAESSVLRPPSSVELIQRALESQTPLEIVYYSPYHDETTTRLVEPLRLEYRDDIPYLIAYCHLARDERTFRLDRIQQLTPRDAETPRRATFRK